MKLAHDITRALRRERTRGRMPWLWPDTKAQVTVEYLAQKGHITPTRIVAVVVTAQHDRTVSLAELRLGIQHMLTKVLPSVLVDKSTIFHVGLHLKTLVDFTNGVALQIQPCGDLGVVPSGNSQA